MLRALALPVLLAVAASSASAEPASDAEALKKEAFGRLAAGDYAAGITAMEKAYNLVKAPGYLLNIALAYDQWSGHCPEARAAFERYFEACKSASCGELKTAEERSARVRDKCEVAVSARTQPPGAQIAIDGNPVGKAPLEFKLGPGVHELAASLEGHQPYVETLTVVEGRPQSLSIALRPVEAPPPPVAVAPSPAPPPPPVAMSAAPAPSPPADEDGGLLASPVFWIIAGAVLVGGSVGLGVALGSGTADPSGGSLGRVFLPGGS